MIGCQRAQLQICQQRLPEARLRQQVNQRRGGVNGQFLHKHAFWPQLGQAADVPHVGVGEKEAIGLAQPVGARGMGAKPISQGVELVLDVGRGVNQPDAGRR